MSSADEFPTTHWSVVLGARNAGTRRPALETLCRAYWSPVYGFVRRQGHDPDAAADLTQAFFARLLEKEGIAAANADRGRFRSFLLGCVKNFLANEWDRAHAGKRHPGSPLLPFAFDDAEKWLGREPANGETPERIFERRWAVTVVKRVLRGLQTECEQEGRGALFQRLKPLLLGDNAEALRANAARLGMTEGALKMTLHRLRRRYRGLLEAEILQTVHDPALVDDEIRHILAALQQH